MSHKKRLIQLYAVLIYDTDTIITQGKNYLTIGQRICINQERAALMRDIPDLYFEQSPIVNEKVAFILDQIRKNNLANAYMAQVNNLTDNN